MLMSMMQIYVRESVEDGGIYRQAFGACVLCVYPDDKGWVYAF